MREYIEIEGKRYFAEKTCKMSYAGSQGEHGKYKCSSCGAIDIEKGNFCRNCGAEVFS